MTSRAAIQIDCLALQHNLSRVRQFAPHSNILAMVKSNAYGHDVVPVVQSLQDADGYGVASFAEALELSSLQTNKPIVIMAGPMSADELIQIAQYGFDIVVHNTQQIAWLNDCMLVAPLRIWLKIDTGMHRLGFTLEQVAPVYEALKNSTNVQQEIILMTHCSDADDLQVPKTKQQLNQFNRCTETLTGPKSIANSAGIIAWPDTHTDWVRPGVMLYGVSPMLGDTALDYDLKPVMTFVSKLIAIKKLEKGAEVGYGSTWRSPAAMTMGVVAAGYGDGYPRHARSGTPVLINHQRCPIIGRVSMDMLAVDLTKCSNAKQGDQAVLWGKGLPIEEIAAAANTISYELLCNVSRRVERIYDIQ